MLGPSGLTYKTFFVIINFVVLQANVFFNISHFHPSTIFVGKGGAYPSGATCKTPI
jgi:hypothetical protein